MTRRLGTVVDDERLRDREEVFVDRAAAGEALAGLMADTRGSDTVVLAVPAGGVPVAAVLARMLGLALDVAVVSKITLPWNTEAGYGAVAFDGSVVLNEALIQRLALPQAVVDEGIARTRSKVEAGLGLHHDGRRGRGRAGRRRPAERGGAHRPPGRGRSAGRAGR
jgi:predicted phosphoribosyltransferase